MMPHRHYAHDEISNMQHHPARWGAESSFLDEALAAYPASPAEAPAPGPNPWVLGIGIASVLAIGVALVRPSSTKDEAAELGMTEAEYLALRELV